MFETTEAIARSAAASAAAPSEVGRDIWRTIRRHAGFLTLVGIASVGLWLVDRSGLAPGAFQAVTIPFTTSLLILAIPPYAVAVAVAWRAVFHRQAWPDAWRTARAGLASTERVMGLLLTVVGVKVLMMATVGWKVALPAIRPYHFDVALAHWDRILHGADPWRLLAPVFGGPVGLTVLDAAYRLWFVVLPLFVVWQGWRRPSPDRTKFLLALAVTWVLLAVVVAVAVSSAGPVYYERLTGLAGPYRDLLASHQGLNLVATSFQEELWWAYQYGPRGPVAGISAFPSLHVAMPTLMALALWREHRAWSLAMWGYTLAILIGSIMLAWHYALDGEASIVLVGAIWWMCGYLSKGRLPALGRWAKGSV